MNNYIIWTIFQIKFFSMRTNKKFKDKRKNIFVMGIFQYANIYLL
jgi:hypothetical protein